MQTNIINSYLKEAIVNSELDKCEKLNSLIEMGITTSDEIIEIVLFHESFKDFLPNILPNILKNISFNNIEEFEKIRNYMSLINDVSHLININDYLVPRLREFTKKDYSTQWNGNLNLDSYGTYCDWVLISFKLHLKSCIRMLKEKSKEIEIIELLKTNDEEKIGEFLRKVSTDNSYDDIIKKYNNEFRKILIR